MRAFFKNLGSLILLIFVVPLLIIFIGPLFVLTALRGQQPIGPLTLNTSRYGWVGRIGALMLGLALWLLIWSSLLWVGLNRNLPVGLITQNFVEEPIPATATATPSATPSPSATLPPTATATQQLATAILVDVPDAEPTLDPLGPATATPQKSPTPTPSPTATLVSTPTSPVQPTVEVEALTPPPLPTATPFDISDHQAALAVVNEGNQALRKAISTATEESLEQLGVIWRGRAFEKAETFAIEHHNLYQTDFEVQYDYLTPLTVSSNSTTNQILVISQENWKYGGPATDYYEEAFEFIYTLIQEDGRWIITNYTYRNIPTATPTATGSDP